MGVENDDIPNEGVHTSSSESCCRAWKARLNGPNKWSAPASEVEPWIQADINYQTYVSGVLTQGDGDAGSKAGDWITSFNVSTFLVNSDSVQMFVQDDNGNVLVSLNTQVYKLLFTPVCPGEGAVGPRLKKHIPVGFPTGLPQYLYTPKTTINQSKTICRFKMAGNMPILFCKNSHQIVKKKNYIKQKINTNMLRKGEIEYIYIYKHDKPDTQQR